MKIVGLLLFVLSVNAQANTGGITGVWKTTQKGSDGVVYNVEMNIQQDNLMTTVRCSKGATKLLNVLSTKISLDGEKLTTLETKEANLVVNGVDCSVAVVAGEVSDVQLTSEGSLMMTGADGMLSILERK